MKSIPAVYLASSFLSLLGNSIAGVALPLLVLQITGSALGAGAVAAASAVPAVFAGLVMGVVIDRINRRTASCITDLVSGASVAALPLVDAVTGLSIGWFVLFGIIGSLGDVPGLTAREALLPAVVRSGGLSAERLMGLREALSAVALLLGPAVAGTLLVLWDASAALWVTAATSLAAALLTLLIPRRVGEIPAAGRAEGTAPRGGWRMLRDGWRVLLGSPFLLLTTALSLVSALLLAALQALILPVYFTQIGRPELLGFVLTALAAGMLLGGGGYALAGTRLSRRGWLLAGVLGSGAGFGVIAALASPGAVLAGAALLGAASGVFGSLVGVLMIERIPEAMRGRIMGTQNALLTAAPPLGIVAAALLTEFAGLGAAAIAIAAIWIGPLLLGVFAPPLRSLDREGAGDDGDHGNDHDTAAGAGPARNGEAHGA
ncbi:MFS transporter [Leucobacter massiliensis]|uniref:Multidrug efflux pump Tap n=1 Tax=Leucobacter massiliensis TaxID=1686285 RepID=A0A2S9QS15_9MICO|nr:MFS transporter [Leucobacter massiliensis]PRI12362.1 MFS transporter [Leucobacter massiliensis]